MAGQTQDDARENRLVDLFNLTRPENRVRHGTDALLLIDGHTLEFELKSVTTEGGSVSTVRDLGPDHIAKWKNKHWIVAWYVKGDLAECRYGSPDDMAPWVQRIWEYIRLDFEMAQLVPALVTADVMHKLLGQKEIYEAADAKRLHKQQYTAKRYKELMDAKDGYTPDRMLEIVRDRCRYVIERGSTLNNPHIPGEFFKSWVSIKADHAVVLRERVRTWLASKPPESLAQADTIPAEQLSSQSDPATDTPDH